MRGEWRRDAVVIGIHLGLDGYHHRVVRDNLGPNNIQWNLRYFRGIDRNRGSLVYAHYTFRTCILLVVMHSHLDGSAEAEVRHCIREEAQPFENSVISCVLYNTTC